MRLHPGLRRLGLLGVCALTLGLAGCHKTYDFKGALIALPKAQDLFAQASNIDIVLVSPVDGTVFPKKALIEHTYAVIWVSDGQHLDIHIPDASVQPQCGVDMALCVLFPVNLSQGEHTYDGQVTDSQGKKHTLDPKIEIVR